MDHSRSDIARLESKVSGLLRDLDGVQSRLRGVGTEIVVVPTGIEGWGDQIRVLGSILGRVTLKSSVDHMWKVTQSGETDGVPEFSARGGVAVIQGTRVVVADVVEVPLGGHTATTKGGGFVTLKVTRDNASRAYDSDYPPVIEFHATVPPSTDEEEYTVLAEVTATSGDVPPDITQCRRDEICSYELLIVANGEFALMPFQTNSRNSYAPPVPSP
jgi:hypothetical protein